jgi:parallel beta helix pectate lyase-like protein
MRMTLAAAAAALLLLPAAAGAQTYPEPKEPGKIAPKPKGPFKTHSVCKQKGRCDFRSIQAAVNKAKAGDKIAVRKGVYKESVTVSGAKKRYLRFVGDPKHPRRVVLEGSDKKQNGFFVSGADQVTIDGFTARNYKANGFFVVNAVGYKLTHLVAAKSGVYGVYAFNSKGGEMSHSESYYHSDAGFYIGQTPQQTNPIRSMVRDVKSWGNPIGFSATNMRYVTITESQFFNNGIGIVPNALESEKFPPAEANVITDNDVFWNNFNFHEGAPFKPKDSGVVPLVPIGTGILLLGGRTNRIEDNRVYGNYLVGVAALEGFLLDKTIEARALVGNRISGNAFGAGGEDLNGRDFAYDGNGRDNCWGPNSGVQNTLPADPAMFPACPFSGANAFSQDTQNELLGFAGANALKGWIRHPHKPKPGYRALEVYEK